MNINSSFVSVLVVILILLGILYLLGIRVNVN